MNNDSQPVNAAPGKYCTLCKQGEFFFGGGGGGKVVVITLSIRLSIFLDAQLLRNGCADIGETIQFLYTTWGCVCRKIISIWRISREIFQGRELVVQDSVSLVIWLAVLHKLSHISVCLHDRRIMFWTNCLIRYLWKFETKTHQIKQASRAQDLECL